MNRPSAPKFARVAQGVWLVVAASITVTWGGAVAFQWGTMISICHPASTCANFQLNAATARTLSEHGVSPLAYAVYTAVIVALVWSVWCGLAALIIWRRPDDRGTLVSAFFMVLFPLFDISFWFPTSSPILSAVNGVMGALSLFALLLFGLLFPDGRFVPGWTRWLAALFVPVGFITGLSAFAATGLSTIFLIGTVLMAVACPIYRFRSVSSWAERQRTKWAFLGLIVTIVGLVALVLPFFVKPSLGQGGTLYEDITVTAVPILTSAIPVSLGIAILRSRLWDIDRVISRALVYGTLSLTLAGIYVGGVIGFQALFGLFAGNGSAAAIAISTLAIVALFGPLRRRIQAGIDRRFYRGKYDAAKTLSAFGERLRDQVDLAHLSQDLTSVVHDTLHPDHVSLWLRDAGRAAPVSAGGRSIR